MDPEVERVVQARARVQTATLWTGLGTLVYLIILIAVASQLRTPLPFWAPALFVPMPVLLIALPVLRYLKSSLLADEARARLDALSRDIDDLEAEQKRHRRR